MDQRTKAEKKAEQERLQREKERRWDARMEKIERRVPFMNVGNALKVACVGFSVGVVLRVVQMLYCFDYDTGFYTDGGTLAWLCLLLAAITVLLCGAMCFCSRRYFGPYVPRKSASIGVVAVLSGLILLLTSYFLLQDYRKYLVTGTSVYESSSRAVIHLAFLVTGFLFGAVQIFAAVGFFRGKNNLEKVPLLYLVGVFWGISYLILVYVFYAKSSSFVENFFAVAGGASTLLCLFYLCKLFAGMEEESAAKRVFVCGIFSAVFTVTYAFSNIVLFSLGRTYSGEIPVLIQLSSLGVSVYLLAFLMAFRKYSLRRVPREPDDAPPVLEPMEPVSHNTGPIPGTLSGASEKPAPRSRGGRRFRPD